MEENWEKMVNYYKEHIEYFSFPVTETLDTVLHLAIHSNEEQPLKDLLEIMKENELPLPVSKNHLNPIAYAIR